MSASRLILFFVEKENALTGILKKVDIWNKQVKQQLILATLFSMPMLKKIPIFLSNRNFCVSTIRRTSIYNIIPWQRSK